MGTLLSVWFVPLLTGLVLGGSYVRSGAALMVGFLTSETSGIPDFVLDLSLDPFDLR